MNEIFRSIKIKFTDLGLLCSKEMWTKLKRNYIWVSLKLLFSKPLSQKTLQTQVHIQKDVLMMDTNGVSEESS